MSFFIYLLGATIVIGCYVLYQRRNREILKPDGAGCLLMHNNNVLLLERNPTYVNNKRKAHELEFPGGKYDPTLDSVPFFDTALREVREETGIILKPDQLSNASRVNDKTPSNKETTLFVVHLNQEQVQSVELLRRKLQDEKQKAPESREAQDMHWIPVESIRNIFEPTAYVARVLYIICAYEMEPKKLRKKIRHTNTKECEEWLQNLSNSYTLTENLHSLRGALKRKLKDYEGALEDLNEAVKQRPDCIFSLLERGAVKARMGKFEEAIEDLNVALALNPVSSDLGFIIKYRSLAKLGLGDYEGALKDFKLARKFEPSSVLVRRRLGKIYQHFGKYKKALKEFKIAIKLRNDDPEILVNLNAVQLVLGNHEGTLAFPKASLPKQPDTVMQMNDTMKNLSMSPTFIPFVEFQVIKKIGEGGFGEVFLAVWNKKQVALKTLKAIIHADNLVHEANLLAQLRHDSIVSLIGVTADMKNNFVLVMEYMEYGSVYDLLFVQQVKLTTDEVVRLALDVALGLDFLHQPERLVIHRDLKSSNVLLYRKRRGKISDFGTSRLLPPNIKAETVVGTLGIAIAPEILSEENYNEKVDVFAFGVLLYEMLTNQLLPQIAGIHLQRINAEISSGNSLMSLVLECCAPDPNQRPTMLKIIKLLNDRMYSQ